MALRQKVQPVVVVFRANEHPRKRRPEIRTPTKRGISQQFAFINVSSIGDIDEDSNRLIKTHAAQHVHRQAEPHKVEHEAVVVCRGSKANAVYARERSSDQGNSPRSLLSPNPLALPIQQQPYMPKLIHDYVALVLPFDPDLRKSTWFQLVMTDAALFHALISVSALIINVVSASSSKVSLIQNTHMFEAIRLINCRLTSPNAMSDTTIMTILFMAKVEYLKGNVDTWNTHMNGVRAIVARRGRIRKLSKLIQQKICTVGLLGCIECGDMPHFACDDLEFPTPAGCGFELPSYLNGLAEAYKLDPQLTKILAEIPIYVASPEAATVEISSIQYRLISLYSMNRQRELDIANLRGSFKYPPTYTQRQIIEECLSIGAFFYLSLFQPATVLTSIRPINYNYLLGRLQRCTDLLFNHRIIPCSSVLLAWLLFLGEIFVLPRASGTHTQLRAIATEMSISTWDEMRTSLSAVCWTQSVYTECYRSLWEEMQA